MYLFVALLVPAAYVYFISGKDDIDLVRDGIPYCAGLAAGIVAIIFERLVLSFFPPLPASFLLKFLMFFLSDTLVPFVLGNLLLFFLFEAPVKQKISRIRQHSFGIASIFLPYSMIVFYSLPDTWPIIMIPVMVLSILFLIDFYAGKLVASPSRSPDGQDIVFTFLPVLVALIFADAAKTLWYFKYPFWFFLPLSLIVTAFAFILRLAKYRK